MYINHIYGIYKNGIDDLICKAEIETQNKCTDTKEGREGRRYWEIGTVYKMDN